MLKVLESLNYVIKLCIGCLIGLCASTSFAFANSADDFKFKQLQMRLAQYEQVINVSPTELLQNSDIPAEDLALFIEGLVRISRGELFEGRLQCADQLYVDALEGPFVVATPKERLVALPDLGGVFFWGALQLSQHQKDKGGETYIQCDRLKHIVDVIAKFDPKALNTAKDLKKALYQSVTLDASGKVKEALVYVPRFTSAKAALAPVQDALLETVSSPHHALAQALITQADSADSVHAAVSGVQDIFIETLTDLLKQEASFALFNGYTKLPSSVHNTVSKFSETPTSFDKAYSDAKRSYDNLISESSGSVSQQMADKYVIHTFVEELSFALRSEVLRTQQSITNLQKEAETFYDKVEKDICSALSHSDQKPTLHFKHNQWGQLPTEDKPLGYRYTATPMAASTEYVQKETHYKVILEVLIYEPSAGYALSKVGADIEGHCDKVEVASFRAVNVGFALVDVLRNNDISGFSKGFYIDPKNTNNNVVLNQEATIEALEGLGIPAAWLPSALSWVISQDFQNVALETGQPLIGAITLIEEQKMVFKPSHVGPQFCQLIKDELLAPSLQAWTANREGQIALAKGWGLSFKAMSKGGLQSCHSLYDQFKQKGKSAVSPFPYSQMLVQGNFALSGNLAGESFIWPVQVGLLARPSRYGAKEKIQLKSTLFGPVPNNVKSKVNELVQAVTKQSLTLSPHEEVSITARLGSVGQFSDLKSIDLPLLLEVGIPNCATQSVSANIELPSGKFNLSEEAMVKAFKPLLRCKAELTASDLSAKWLSCDKLNTSDLSLIQNKPFGLSDFNIKAQPLDSGKRCIADISGKLFNHDVRLTNVHVVHGKGLAQFDFSQAKGSAGFIDPLKAELKKIAGPLADKGLRIEPQPFTGKALPLHIVFEGGDSPLDIGPVDIGIITLSANGSLTFNSEVKRVLVARASIALESRLTALARMYAPSSVTDLKVNIGLNEAGQLYADANFTYQFNEAMPNVPARLALLPSFNTRIQIDEAYLKDQAVAELTKYLNSILPLKQGPVKIDDLKPVPMPDYNVAFSTGITIDLDALGKISVKNLHVGSEGVDLQGRAELQVGADILLVPSVVPIYLAKPGIFYDFTQKRAGALGDLTVAAPDIAKLAKIRAALDVGDPDKFLQELKLTGDLVLMDTLPLVTTEGVLNIAQQKASYDARTTELLEDIFSMKMSGDLDGGSGTLGLNSELTIFDVELSRSYLSIDAGQCPKDCIRAGIEKDFLIGKGDASVVTGPFLVDGVLTAEFSLIEGLGKAHLTVSDLKAKLGASLFNDLISLKVTTPGIKQMTPAYLLSIIASLLDVSVDDLKKWLKDPEFKLAPAGSPSSGEDVAQGDGRNPGSKATSTGERAGTGNAYDVLSLELPPEGTPSQIPKEYQIEQYRRKHGNSLVACDTTRHRQTWGFATYYGSGWYYNPHYALNDHIFKKVCGDQIKKLPIRGGKIYAIADTYRPVFFDVNYLHPNIREYEALEQESADFTDAATPYYTYTIGYQTKSKPSERFHYYTSKVPVRRFSRMPIGPSYIMVEDPETLEVDKELYPEIYKILDGNSISEVLESPKKTKAIIDFLNLDRKKAKKLVKFEEVGGAFSGWFGSSMTYKFTYYKQARHTSSRQRQLIQFWASLNSDRKTVKDVVLNVQCGNYWQSPDTATACVQPTDLDAKAKQVLLSLKPQVIGGADVILSANSVKHLLNNAVPSLLSDGKDKPVPQQIPIDQQASQCNVTSIEITDMGDYWTYTFGKQIEDRDLYELSTLSVSKNGMHKPWTMGSLGQYRNIMGNYLACVDDPSNWLQDNRVWVLPSKLKDRNLLLFKNIYTRGAYEEIISVQSGNKPHPFESQKNSPYGSIFSALEKQGIFDLVFTTKAKRFDSVVNTHNQWEAALVEGDSRSVLQLRTAKTSSCKDSVGREVQCLIMQGKSERDYELATSNLNRCLENLGVEASRRYSPLRMYLSVNDAAHIYGIGHLALLEALKANENYNCSF